MFTSVEHSKLTEFKSPKSWHIYCTKGASLTQNSFHSEFFYSPRPAFTHLYSPCSHQLNTASKSPKSWHICHIKGSSPPQNSFHLIQFIHHSLHSPHQFIYHPLHLTPARYHPPVHLFCNISSLSVTMARKKPSGKFRPDDEVTVVTYENVYRPRVLKLVFEVVEKDY